MERKWFAVHTKPQWEKRVAEVLTKRGITNFCPINKVIIPRRDQYRIITRPLFNSYVFVNIAEKQLAELRKVEGIISTVHWLGKPAVIIDSEIEAMKLFLQEHNNVRLEKAVVEVNDNVLFSRGSLELVDGSKLDASNHTVRVFLPSLGYVLLAQIQYTDIEEEIIVTESF